LLAPLLALAPTFANLVRPGGRIALTGLLVDQTAAIERAYGDTFALDGPRVRGEWCLLAGVRREP
ncbi:MAG: 50S ribosomal protein L11 methyltransferase, partial [Gammaproteobacteria bacterium]